MRFLFCYPEARGTDRDLLDAGSIPDVAVAAEASGWDGIAFTEHPAPSAKWLDAGGHQTLDPFVALASAAAVTTRLRLLTYLAVVPYRNPLLLAKAAATLDLVSNGRFVLGTGTGYLKTEFIALGVDFAERNELFDEALEVLPLCWSGEQFSYDGRHFQARDVIVRPRPTQPTIPMWIGGNSKQAMLRVAGNAAGWIPLWAPPGAERVLRTRSLATVDDLAARIVELREMAGPRAEELAIAPVYADESIASPTVDADRHREAFAELEAAGATHVMITGSTREPSATGEFLDAFGATYIAG